MVFDPDDIKEIRLTVSTALTDIDTQDRAKLGADLVAWFKRSVRHNGTPFQVMRMESRLKRMASGLDLDFIADSREVVIMPRDAVDRTTLAQLTYGTPWMAGSGDKLVEAVLASLDNKS